MWLQCWTEELFSREGSCLTRYQLCLQLPSLWEAELLLYSKCDANTPCWAAEEPTLVPSFPSRSLGAGPTLPPELCPCPLQEGQAGGE